MIVDIRIGQIYEIIYIRPHVVFHGHVVIESFGVVLEVVTRETADKAAVFHVLLGAPLWEKIDFILCVISRFSQTRNGWEPLCHKYFLFKEYSLNHII